MISPFQRQALVFGTFHRTRRDVEEGDLTLDWGVVSGTIERKRERERREREREGLCTSITVM